jgi:hypothetical protein
MKSRLAVTTVALALLASGVVLAVNPAATVAQPADSTAAPPPATPPPAQAPPTPPPPPPPATTSASPAASSSGSSFKQKLYFGGTVSLSFGNPDQIGFFPMVGYKVTPKLSAGVEVGYEYVSYDDPINESTSNYGAGVFGRYRLTPRIYGHVEYEAVNYEIFSSAQNSDRETVPFLLVGGGYVMPIAPRTSVYAEVLFDVLQDDSSPYDSWDPFFSVGVGVGF